MERARWKAPAASRVDLVGASVGSPVGRALASEESCLDCNAQPAMDKEPVLVISTSLHQYTSAFLRKNNSLECSNESSVGIRVCERNCVPSPLPVVVTQCRCAMVRQSTRFHRQEVRQHLRSSPLLWCTATSSSSTTPTSDLALMAFSKNCEFISVNGGYREKLCKFRWCRG